MAEKLGEIGDVLSNICKAVKTAKSLRDKNSELFRTIEETKKQAIAVENINIENEPSLNELKQVVRRVRDNGARLEIWVKNFSSEITSFDQFVTTNIQGKTIPPGAIKDLCEALQRMHTMANGFSNSFEKFTKHLIQAQELATKLTEKLKEKEQQMQKNANSTGNKGFAGTAGLVVTGVSLAALGFFTGGAAWVAAGAVAGVACGVGATVVGVKTASSVKEMQELASGILKDANNLDAIAKNLKSSVDRAVTIKMDEEALQALQAALEFFKRDVQREEALSEKDAEIAALRAQLRSLGH